MSTQARLPPNPLLTFHPSLDSPAQVKKPDLIKEGQAAPVSGETHTPGASMSLNTLLRRLHDWRTLAVAVFAVAAIALTLTLSMSHGSASGHAKAAAAPVAFVPPGPGVPSTTPDGTQSTQFAFCDQNTHQTPGSGGIFTSVYQLDGVYNGRYFQEYEVYFATFGSGTDVGAYWRYC